MSSALIVISPLLLLNTVFAAPISNNLHTRQAAPACNNGKAHLYQPELHNIYIYSGVPSFPSISNTFNVMNGSSSRSEQQQVAVWRNVPASTTCTIRWSVAADRSFSVYNNGLVASQQLVGLPPGAITADTIKGLESSKPPTSALDFTFWPEIAGPHDHVGPAMQCGSEVVVKLFKDPSAPGSITLEQSQQSGLYLEVDC
ncbi:hypothetical protein H2198_006379 [Neophaeococcomyces mojaviensis]|uniref:Uncharacterized protein n=1 Tax=Neophaeococcomyces mojaviensis TaxID=3383035 RepID=A0ACC3A336_9EURO|nr:hypothetical protein H2198_006379 [Knufia sp. JES_112]